MEGRHHSSERPTRNFLVKFSTQNHQKSNAVMYFEIFEAREFDYDAIFIVFFHFVFVCFQGGSLQKGCAIILWLQQQKHN